MFHTELKPLNKPMHTVSGKKRPAIYGI